MVFLDLNDFNYWMYRNKHNESHSLTCPLAFQTYAVFVFASVLALVYYFAPKYGQSNLIVYVLICSLAGSLSVIGVKVVSICTSEFADVLHTCRVWELRSS